MDPWIWIGGIAMIIGIMAGIVQVVQYLQDRREKKRQGQEPPTRPGVPSKPLPQPTVPSNLPPRSEFIGREKEKARIYEALASRWPLTCIDGIGGIGKTVLALEVAHECLTASKGTTGEHTLVSSATDAYSAYTAAANQLLQQLGRQHSRYSEALVYQQRLHENISRARRYGDIAARQVERSEIIDRLNELSLSVLNLSFNEIYQQVEATAEQQQPEVAAIPTFDGFIWTTAKDRDLSLNDVLDAVAHTLDYPGIAQQPLKKKRESVRRLLQNKSYLLVLDNFETVTDEAVRDFLLWLPEPSKALITSREQNIPQAMYVSIKGLEWDEALALIHSEGRRLGLTSLEQVEAQELSHLYEATGGAPLAIKWAMGQIKQKGQSWDTVLAALHGARGSIFNHIFARSWNLLTADAQKVLLVMPLFAASASRVAIEAAGDVHHYALDEGLGQLVELWLVEVGDELEESQRRYSIHPLTRAFADREARRVPRFIEEASYRLAICLMEFTEGSRKVRAAFDRVELELANILKAIRWCYQARQWQMVLDFRAALLMFMQERGYWDEMIEIATWAMEAANALGDKVALGYCYVGSLVWVYRYREDLALAEQGCNKALDIFGELGHEAGTNRTKFGLGDIALRAGDYAQAQEIFEDVLTRLQHVDGDKVHILTAMLHLSRLACTQGDLQKAEELGRKVQEQAARIGDTLGLAASYFWIGNALYMQDRLAEAHQCFIQSLEINEANGIRHGVAWNKASLALIAEKRGNLGEALLLAREADVLHRKLGMRRELQETEDLIARLERNLQARKAS